MTSMKTRNTVVVGSAGHARVVIDIIEKDGSHRIVGLLDRFRKPGEEELGYPVLGKEEDLPALVEAHGVDSVVIAIGDNFIRGQVAAKIEELCPSIEFASVVHPGASVGRDVSIGPGTVVMAGAAVNPLSTVGRFCILNTNASLDHDSTLGDFASLAPNSVTGGDCRIGKYAAIGIGATLVHGVEIGDHAVVGAGSLVLESVAPYTVAYGSPAKLIRSREAGDKYL